MPTGGALGQVEGGSGLGEAQPGEIPELDEIGLERVLGCQPVQSLVQCEEIFAGFGDGRGIRVECLALHRTAMARGGLPPRVIDEDAPHCLGSGGKEMTTIVPQIAVGRSNQPQVRFVDEGGRLKRIARRLGG